jgi:hypothetical protein
MDELDHYDGYTPSKRSAEMAIDHETDGQTLRRVLRTYRRELLAVSAGVIMAGFAIWGYHIVLFPG